MPSSSRKKHPEKHRQRRPELPRANPIECTQRILAPELPGSIMAKRASMRSQLTALTQDSQSTTQSDQSRVIATRVDEGETEAASSSPGSFFIPGITGKARCLEQESVLNGVREFEADSILEQTSREGSRSSTSRRTVNYKGDSVGSGRTSHATEGKYSTTSDNNNSLSGLDDAHFLYDAVVDSIQSRRAEGINGLGEDEFQRMLKELEKDMDQMEVNAAPTLRDQVLSIRSLLNDYEGRKAVLKHREKKGKRK